jgi:penicillin-binding protein 1C
MRKRLYRFSCIIAACILVLLLIFVVLDIAFPVKNINQNNFSRLIAARDGTPLRSFSGPNGVWRSPVLIKQVSPLYLEALIGYEDRWFYYHPGINPVALFRAYQLNRKAGKIVSGGSTITMQTARLLSPHSRNYLGKIKQIFCALQLECHYSKDEILEIYLNIAPFGGTQEGIGAASLRYLGKMPLELSHSEAALLAVLPQAPSRYRPDRYPAQAKKARDKVLNRLSRYGVWQQEICQDAKQEIISRELFDHPQLAPLLARRLKTFAEPGIPLISTIDAVMQQNLADFSLDYIMQLPAGTSAGLLVVEHNTMAVRAYIGSADFLDKSRFGHVDMVQAIRSPGSTLKPFLYGMALDMGLIHSHSLLSDSPRIYHDYQPENFSKGFSGPVTATHALRRSLNIPALQLMEKVGPITFTGRLMGGGVDIHLPHAYRPSLAVILGGVGVSLEQLVEGYTCLARKGKSSKLKFLEKELQHQVQEKRMMSEGASWIIRNILKDNPRPARYQSEAIISTPIAWKTGTSYGFRDTWALGVTPTYTIGVWIGRPDGTPLPGHSGGMTAAPLLLSIADNLLKKGEHFSKQPLSVSTETICWPLGIKENGNKELCHEKHRAFIVDLTIPPTFSSPDQKDWLVNPISISVSKSTGLLIPTGCKYPNSQQKQIALWPKDVEPWIEQHFRRSQQIPAVDPSCSELAILSTGELKIIGIEQDSIFYFDFRQSQIQLKAIGGLGPRFWFFDGSFIGKIKENSFYLHTVKKKGEHQLTVRDEMGNTDTVSFSIQ